MNAEHLMLVGGVGSFLLTVHWVRRRRLREKYAVYWLGTASLLLVVGLFPNLLMRFAETAHLSYSSAVLFWALGFIYLFAMSTSVSISQQHRKLIRLQQEMALLRYQVERDPSRMGTVSEIPAFKSH